MAGTRKKTNAECAKAPGDGATLPGFAMRAKVLKSEDENSLVSHLTLDLRLEDVKPGQFVMAWLPGMNEKPMSIAESNPNLEIAVARAGPCSKKIADLKVGDEIYIRGPYGVPYAPSGKRWVLVGGGYGFAPLRFLARIGVAQGAKVTCINGARNSGLIMKPSSSGETIFCTDDGSKGIKGNVLAALEPILKKEKVDCVYSCGPERMLEALAVMCKKYGVRSQLSVERYMKCGFGVCGHCDMGGWLSCYDGPTIDGEDALANPEFGKVHKDKAGRRMKH